MSGLRARVQNGRLVLDIPVDLPEGLVLDLVLDDDGDDLTEEERASLDRALQKAIASAEAGGGRPIEEFLGDFRPGG